MYIEALTRVVISYEIYETSLWLVVDVDVEESHYRERNKQDLSREQDSSPDSALPIT